MLIPPIVQLELLIYQQESNVRMRDLNINKETCMNMLRARYMILKLKKKKRA